MEKAIDTLQFWKRRIETAVSEHYSVYVIHEQGWKIINESHQKIFDEVIPKEATVLDAGCAYGRWSENFRNYVGVDFSPDFIAKAKEKHPSKDFIVGNLKDLPFTDHQFEWAFCISIKKMVEDNLGIEEWKKIENELKRVARHVLILEYEDPKPYEII